MSEDLDRIRATPREPLHRQARAGKEQGFFTVQEDPRKLAEEAGVDLETYALARTIASEAGRKDSPEKRLAIAEAVRNEAYARDKPIFDLVTQHKNEALRGRFGEQRGRFVATSQDPTQQDLVTAQMALQGSNIAEGATSFMDTQAQAAGVQRGHKLRPPEEIVERRRQAGLEVHQLAGVPLSEFTMFKPVGRIAEKIARRVGEGARAAGQLAGEVAQKVGEGARAVGREIIRDTPRIPGVNTSPFAVEGAEDEDPFAAPNETPRSSVILRNDASGQDEPVDPSMVPGMLKSGDYAISDPDARVPVRGPGGQVGTVPIKNLQPALDAGYSVLSSEQMALQQQNQGIREQAHTPGGKLGTFVGSLASGVTLGGSDWLLKKVAPEGIERQRIFREENPGWSMAGEVAGVVAPFGAAAKAGGLAAKAIAGTGKAAKIARGLARGAAEGGAIGAGDVLRDAAVSQSPVDSEKLAANLKTSIMTGGVLGGVLGLGGAAIGVGGEVAGKAAVKVAGKAKEIANAAGPLKSLIPGAELVGKAARIGAVVEATNKRLSGSLKRFLDASSPTAAPVIRRAAQGLYHGATGVTRRLRTDIGEDVAKKEQTLAEEYQANESSILDAVEEAPDGKMTVTQDYQSRIDANVSDLAEVSPMSAAVVGGVMNRRIQFLAQELPKRPPVAAGLGRGRWLPSKLDMQRFNRMVEAAEDPVSIFEKMERGALTPDQARTVREVYPQLYTEAKVELISQMAEQDPKKVPYWKRLQASIFTDMALDAGLVPEVFSTLQGVHDFDRAMQEEKKMELRPGSEPPTQSQQRMEE